MACPYAAFLRYQAAIKTPMTPWLVLGNAVHHALEKIHEEKFTLDEAVKLFRDEYHRLMQENEVFVSFPQLRKLETEGIEMLERYNAQIQSGEISQEPLALEKEFAIPFFEKLDIVGRIDKVEYIQGIGYIIIDYKTGKPEPDEWFLRHDLQLTCYAWACLTLYGELPGKIIYHHLRSGKLLETTRTMQDIEDLKQMISNAIMMHENGIRHRIFHDKICGQCDFRGKICDDKELERNTIALIS